MPDTLPHKEGRGLRWRLAALVVGSLVGVAAGGVLSWNFLAPRPGDTVEIETGTPPNPGVSTIPVASVIHAGKGAEGVAVDPVVHTLYTANSTDGTVSVIDTATGAVVATIPVGGVPEQLTVDPDTHAVYVSDTNAEKWDDREVPVQRTKDKSKGGAVSVIDGTTRAVVATIPVHGSASAVAIDPRTHIAYIATTNWPDIDMTNQSDDETGYLPEDLTEDLPDNEAEYVPEDATGSLTMVDTATLAVIGSIPLPAGRSPSSVALDPTANTAYVTDTDGRDQGSAVVVDTATRAVVNTLFDGTSPQSVVVDPVAHTLYTTASPNEDTASLIVSDARKGTTTTIRMEDYGLRDAVIDPRTGVVYALTGNTVTGIGPVARKVVLTIPLGHEGNGLAIDPKSGVLYATDRSDSVSVIRLSR